MVKLNFDIGSKAGHLYSDILAHYQQKGVGEDELFRRMNIGCVDSFDFIPVTTQDSLALDSCEAVGHAYQNFGLHYLLAKHKYPLPIGMNDYNPATILDEEIRKEIDVQAAADIKALAGQGMTREHPRFSYEVAKRAHLWGRRELFHAKDCDVEADDWEAINQKCGLCTETSSSVYYYLTQAGLKPQFFFTDQFDVTLSNYNRLSSWGWLQSSPTIYSHIFTGIYLESENRWLHIDIMDPKFDSRHKYVQPIDNRQFVAGILTNRIKDLMDAQQSEKAYAVASQCVEISGNYAACDFFNVRAVIHRLFNAESGKESLFSLLQELEGKLFSGNIEETPNRHIFAIIHSLDSSLYSSNIEKFNAILDRLLLNLKKVAEVDKKGAARYAVYMCFQVHFLYKLFCEKTQHAAHLEPIKKIREKLLEIKHDLLFLAIELDPKYINAYWVIRKLGNPVTVFQKMQDYTESHPQNPIAYYLLAESALHYAANLPKDKSATLLDEVERSISHLESLEESDVSILGLKAALSLLKRDGKIQEIVTSVESFEEGEAAFDLYRTLSFYYLEKKDFLSAKKKLQELVFLSPFMGRLFLTKTVVQIVNQMNLPEPGKETELTGTIGSIEEESVFEFFVWIAKIVSEEPRGLGKVWAKQIYAVLFVLSALTQGRKSSLKMWELLGTPTPASYIEMNNVTYKFMHALLRYDIDIYRKIRIKFLDKFKLFLKQLTKDKSLSVQDSGVLAVLLFLVKAYLVKGQLDNARKYFRKIPINGLHVEALRTFIFVECMKFVFEETEKYKDEDVQLAINAGKLILELDKKDAGEIQKSILSCLKTIEPKCDKKFSRQLNTLIAKFEQKLK